MLIPIMNYIKTSGTPLEITIPEWNKLITDLHIKYDIYKDIQSTNQLVVSKGIRLIEYLLSNIDVEYLLTHTDDYEKYNYYVLHMSGELGEYFDPIYKNISSKMFTSNDTIEYILNVKPINPLLTLPMNTDWSIWQNIQPFRIWSHNSLELTNSFIPSQLSFQQDIPSFCIFTIDTISLIYKYIKYVIYTGIDRYDPAKFVKHHLIGNVLDDIVNIWLINLINSIVDNHENVTDIMLNQITNEYTPSSIPSGIESLIKTILKFKKNSISLKTILNTRLLYNSSIADRLSTSYNLLSIPDMRQYRYLSWLKDMTHIELITKLNNIRPLTGSASRFNKDIEKRLQVYKRSNFLNSVKNTTIYDILNISVTKIENILGLN